MPQPLIRRSSRGGAAGPGALALVVAAASLTLGCYTTWDIGPRDVNQLDGYRAPGPAKVVVAIDGDKVEVDQDTELRFIAQNPGSPTITVQLKSIDVHRTPTAGDKAWWLGGAVSYSYTGRTIALDMNQVAYLEARRLSPGKTAAVIVGVVLGVVAVAAIGGAVAAAVSPKD